MKKIVFDEKEYYSYLKVPDDWENLDSFMKWYMDQKMPIRIPVDSFVYLNENATSIVLFRHKNYQVEMYSTAPSSSLYEHFHPNMEIITMQIKKMMFNSDWGIPSEALLDGFSHNGDFNSVRGCVFLTFEKWLNGARMTSAMVNWKGKTAGKLHDALIRKHYPDAYVTEGYADVTLPSTQG